MNGTNYEFVFLLYTLKICNRMHRSVVSTASHILVSLMNASKISAIDECTVFVLHNMAKLVLASQS